MKIHYSIYTVHNKLICCLPSDINNKWTIFAQVEQMHLCMIFPLETNTDSINIIFPFEESSIYLKSNVKHKSIIFIFKCYITLLNIFIND